MEVKLTARRSLLLLSWLQYHVLDPLHPGEALPGEVVQVGDDHLPQDSGTEEDHHLPGEGHPSGPGPVPDPDPGPDPQPGDVDTADLAPALQDNPAL